MEEVNTTTETALDGNKRTQFKPGNPGGPGRPKLTEEQKLMRQAAREKIVDYLEKEGLGAANRVVELSKKAENEKVKLSANQDVLDRIGLGTANKNTIVPIQINFGSDREEFA